MEKNIHTHLFTSALAAREQRLIAFAKGAEKPADAPPPSPRDPDAKDWLQRVKNFLTKADTKAVQEQLKKDVEAKKSDILQRCVQASDILYSPVAKMFDAKTLAELQAAADSWNNEKTTDTAKMDLYPDLVTTVNEYLRLARVYLLLKSADGSYLKAEEADPFDSKYAVSPDDVPTTTGKAKGGVVPERGPAGPVGEKPADEPKKREPKPEDAPAPGPARKPVPEKPKDDDPEANPTKGSGLPGRPESPDEGSGEGTAPSRKTPEKKPEGEQKPEEKEGDVTHTTEDGTKFDGLTPDQNKVFVEAEKQGVKVKTDGKGPNIIIIIDNHTTIKVEIDQKDSKATRNKKVVDKLKQHVKPAEKLAETVKEQEKCKTLAEALKDLLKFLQELFNGEKRNTLPGIIEDIARLTQEEGALRRKPGADKDPVRQQILDIERQRHELEVRRDQMLEQQKRTNERLNVYNSDRSMGVQFGTERIAGYPPEYGTPYMYMRPGADPGLAYAQMRYIAVQAGMPVNKVPAKPRPETRVSVDLRNARLTFNTNNIVATTINGNGNTVTNSDIRQNAASMGVGTSNRPGRVEQRVNTPAPTSTPSKPAEQPVGTPIKPSTTGSLNG